jgi:hypothetical protein
MLSLKTLSLAPRRKARRQTVKTVTVSRPRRQRAPRRRAPRSSPAQDFLSSYTKTLNDPFEYGGVPLGYDCFLPTSQLAGYIRNSLIVNADGSFSLALFPSISNMLQVQNGPSGSTHTNLFGPATNSLGITSNVIESRVVSGGIRCFALFPETSASGVLFGGTVPDFTQSNYQAQSTLSLTQLPGSHIGIGTKGMTATIRPYDNGSFEFFGQNTNGYTSTGIPYMTSAYICGLGFPIGTVVWYEAILNIEGIAQTNPASILPPSDDVAAPTMASFFPTPGALFTAAQSYLSPPVILDGIDAAVSYASGNPLRAAAAAGRVARNLIGSGSNYNRAVRQRSTESRVMIEEMKEDAMPNSATSWSVLRR